MSKRTEQLEQFRDLPDSELEQALLRAQDELFRLRLGHFTNQIDNTMSLKDKRREVARIHTILQRRSLSLESQRAASGKDEK